MAMPMGKSSVAFKLEPELKQATKTAADLQMLSMSDVLRQALVEHLRARGLFLPQQPHHTHDEPVVA
jgi:hypothetical protein